MRNDEIPTFEDWKLDVPLTKYNDADYHWARDKFIGQTQEEMLDYFLDSPNGAAEALYYMPPRPFQYYVMNYVRIFGPGQTLPDWWQEASSGTSSFLRMVAFTLEHHPNRILPVMADLLPTLEHVADNQHLYDADPEIWGLFPERFAEIKQLYAERLKQQV
jgi:hypothetical protein